MHEQAAEAEALSFFKYMHAFKVLLLLLWLPVISCFCFKIKYMSDYMCVSWLGHGHVMQCNTITAQFKGDRPFKRTHHAPEAFLNKLT